MCFKAYAESEDPDQTVARSLSRGLRCPLTESVDTMECINGQYNPC